MSFKEYLLDKNENYTYYKENYESLKEEKKLMERDLEHQKMHIDFMVSELKDKRRDIDLLQNDLISKKDTIDFMEKDLDENRKMVADYEHLIDVLEKKYFENKPSGTKDLKELNIAYVLRGFPILSETFVISEIRWLIEKGYNVIVFSNMESYKPTDLDFEVKNYRFDSPAQLEALLIKYDIDLMHTHFVYPTCTNFTYPVAEKLHIPFTVFAHAFDIFRYNEAALNRVDEISQSEYCKAIFTLSEYHKNYLVDRGVVEDKVVITKQASDYEISPIAEKTNKIKNIISVSRFVEKKGLDVLIDAAKLLEKEDFEFSIYGFGDLRPAFRKRIAKLECENITIMDELPHSQVKDVLINADLLVAPSKIDKSGDRDGFPTVLFESMAVGLPVLTTEVSAIPEIITDGVNGFLTEPNNPKKLAEKIKEIAALSNDELLKIRKQAQSDVENISSVDKTMERYIETIDSI